MQSDIFGENDLISIFVIGDPHFRAKNFQEGEELIEKCVDMVENLTPSIIVLLGDVLDTHEVARNTPWNQACDFIEKLSAVAPTYVLMGNHDLINQNQFLSNKHFFNPLKKWENVYIVDEPIIVEVGLFRVAMCPYTPPGRFVEALDTLGSAGESDDGLAEWQRGVSCIFGHQEFAGVNYGGKESEKGDVWGSSNPPVISGHIHTPCQIGTNVFYPGSSIQVASDEAPDKRVWNITFDSDEEIGSVEALQIDKIDLGLKFKKEIEMAYENIGEFDFDLAEKYYVKIKLRGTPEQFKLFRKSKMYTKMNAANIKICFDPISDDAALRLDLGETGGTKEDLSFENILRLLVKEKPDVVKRAYEELYGTVVDDEEDMEYELVFVGAED